jgi:hypothetical protein
MPYQVKTEDALPMLFEVTTCSAFQAAEQRSSTPLTVVAEAKSVPSTTAEPPQRFCGDQLEAGRWTILEVVAFIFL